MSTDKKTDLFMLAGYCLSSIIVIVSLLSKILISNENTATVFFIIVLAVIGMVGGSATWLKHIHMEVQNE